MCCVSHYHTLRHSFFRHGHTHLQAFDISKAKFGIDMCMDWEDGEKHPDADMMIARIASDIHMAVYCG